MVPPSTLLPALCHVGGPKSSASHRSSSGHDFKFSSLWGLLCFIYPLKGAFLPTQKGLRSLLISIFQKQYCFSRRLCTGKFWTFLEEHYVIISTIISTSNTISITITIILSFLKLRSGRVTCKPHINLVNKTVLSLAWWVDLAKAFSSQHNFA